MNNPALGIHYLVSGFRLILKPSLRKFIIIPLIINITLFIGLFFLLGHFMHELNVWVGSLLPSWLQWLSSLLWVFFFAGFFTVIIYTFVTIANLISAPFNSFLSEKVEFYLTGKILEERSLLDNIKDMPRIIARQLSIIGYYLSRICLILILFLIPFPLLHLILPLVLFLFNAWLMTLTYLDYPTDNHRVSMPLVRDWARQRQGVSLGFGITVLVLSMLPGINFFIIPAAVAGATQFWLEQNKGNA